MTSWLWEIIQWLSLPVLGCLAIVLFRRKYHRDFAFFTAYALIVCVIGVIRFVVYKEFSATIYFYAYWLSDFVIYLAALLAIYETFLRRLFPGGFKVRFFRYLFPSAAALVFLLTFLTAFDSHNKRALLFITSRALDFLCSAVIAFFVFLLVVMGRRLSGLEFNVALGFGIQAAVVLVSAALTTQAHYTASVLARFEPISYDVASLIWLITFWKTEKPAPVSPGVQISPEMVQQARTWESALKDSFRPKKRSQ